MDKAFRGEVWNNIDEAVLSEIVRINAEAVDGKVGNDSYTARATALVAGDYILKQSLQHFDKSKFLIERSFLPL